MDSQFSFFIRPLFYSFTDSSVDREWEKMFLGSWFGTRGGEGEGGKKQKEKGLVKWIGVRPMKPRGKESCPVESKISVPCSPEEGLSGDYYSQKKIAKRQITLISVRDLKRLEDELRLAEPIRPEQTRRNILIAWTDQDRVWSELSIGDQLSIGPDVELEVTGNCDPCWKMNCIHPRMEETMNQLQAFGLCCRIIKGGEISVGDQVEKKEMG